MRWVANTGGICNFGVLGARRARRTIQHQADPPTNTVRNGLSERALTHFSQRDGVQPSGEGALGAHGTRRTIQYLAVILSIAKDLACEVLAGVDHARADRGRIAAAPSCSERALTRFSQTGTSIQPKARLGADHGGVQDLR